MKKELLMTFLVYNSGGYRKSLEYIAGTEPYYNLQIWVMRSEVNNFMNINKMPNVFSILPNSNNTYVHLHV